MSDAQVWVYPPPGEDQPPMRAESNIGPVHRNDWMVLDWTSDTKPRVDIFCEAESGLSLETVIANNTSPPLAVQFLETVPQKGPKDTAYCHVYFLPAHHGNSVVWQYINEESGQGPLTWSAAASTSSVTATATVFVSSGLTTSSTTSTATSAADNAATTSSISSATSTSTTAPASATPSSGSGGSRASLGPSAGLGALAALGMMVVGSLLGFSL